MIKMSIVWISLYSYVEIDFGMQKTDQFIINGMAVHSTEIQDK